MQLLIIAALILLLLLIVVILGLFIQAVVTRELKAKDNLIQDLREDNRVLMERNQDLLNRLMSPDLPTFATLTGLTNSQSSSGSDEYVPQDDASILSRLHGIGTPLYDDQTDPDEDLNMLLEAGGYVNKNGG